jgi:hypothetical protein
MKTLFSLLIMLAFAFNALAQKKCTNQTLSILLNSLDTVKIDVNSVYVTVQPTVSSTVWTTDKISITKVGNVNSRVPGIYSECFSATDQDGLKVECCRTIVVQDKSGSGASVSSVNPSKIQIFPNPVTGKHFTLLGNTILKGGLTEISICNISGQIILNETIIMSETFEFDFPSEINLKAGLYILNLKQNEVFVQSKIMVLL